MGLIRFDGHPASGVCPRSVGQVARDFDLTETAVREWVKQAERDTGTRQDGGLASTERQELAQLRAENRRQREDVEILERATAFFAKETRWGRRSGGRRPRSRTRRPRPGADAIRRDFTADAAQVNQRWCGDITYVATWEGWLYLFS